MTQFGPRDRKVKILATTGPATADYDVLRALFQAGADAFRVNMSHGEHADHAATITAIQIGLFIGCPPHGRSVARSGGPPAGPDHGKLPPLRPAATA